MSGFLSKSGQPAASTVKLLVVSDEPRFHSFISRMTARDITVRIVGKIVATSSKATLLSKKTMLKPDLVILDMGKPVEKGFDVIEAIMGSDASPILAIVEDSDAVLACQAISKGALEVASRSDMGDGDAAEFTKKIKMLSRIKVISHIRGQAARPQEPPPAVSPTNSSASFSTVMPRASQQVVAIASSTGGPKALHVLLSELPANFPCPVVIAQHMADDFIQGMAEWLNRNIPLRVKAGCAGELIQAGTVYLSPSEQHMQMDLQGRIGFRPRTPQDIYFPSCDILLASVARACREKSIGVILTGMGNDGGAGIKAIKEAGGTTIAQNEATSVVFGMPRVAIESGCVDHVLPLQEIASVLLSLVRKRVNSNIG